MSRAMNLTLAEADVVNACVKHKAEISSIETLVSGGTRVVLKTSEGAATLRRVCRTKVIPGRVERTPTRLQRNR